MGISNTVITNYDGRKYPKIMKNFDRVLLDAPCTGLGIISRDPSIKGTKVWKKYFFNFFKSKWKTFGYMLIFKENWFYQLLIAPKMMDI